jgi:hypothetical protein
MTNDLDETLTAQVVETKNNLRWKVEQFHRELKPLTGSEKCPCRKARSQRNHLGYCYLVWWSLKVWASKTKTTRYQARNNLFSDYLRTSIMLSSDSCLFQRLAKVLELNCLNNLLSALRGQ